MARCWGKAEAHVQTCSCAASGKSHQCTDCGASCGNALRRFWYIVSQKNGVKGAITCSMHSYYLLELASGWVLTKIRLVLVFRIHNELTAGHHSAQGRLW